MANFKILTFSKMVSLCTAMTIILFTNCSKQNNNNASGYWTLGGTREVSRYNINFTSRLDSLGYSVLKGNDNPASSTHPKANSIFIWFSKSFPARNGSYEMVNLGYPPFALSDSQIAITGLLTDGSLFRCDVSDTSIMDVTSVASMATWPFTPSGKAKVTVTNGKISVQIPQTIAVYYNACGLDSPYLNLLYQEK
jgi:hypothetical protein